MIHHEHILQQGIVGFVAKAVNVPHVFASHDRAQGRSRYDLVFQARRGIRTGWPDTELLIDGGRTFRCEIKRPGLKLDEESYQGELLTKLCSIGHVTFWANSVMMYGQQLERFGVPLKGNWRTVAQLADEYVLGKIRTQQAKNRAAQFKDEPDEAEDLVLDGEPTTERNKPTNPDAQMTKPRPKPFSKRTPDQIMKFEAARFRSLPK